MNVCPDKKIENKATDVRALFLLGSINLFVTFCIQISLFIFRNICALF